MVGLVAVRRRWLVLGLAVLVVAATVPFGRAVGFALLGGGRGRVRRAGAAVGARAMVATSFARAVVGARRMGGRVGIRRAVRGRGKFVTTVEQANSGR